MKRYVKSIISLFIAITLLVVGSLNCIIVGAEELPNSLVVPYSEDTGFKLMDPDTQEVPEVKMGISVGESNPSDTYDLTLEWGEMILKYTFTTDESGALTGGYWGTNGNTCFDGTNNKITITNNTAITDKDVKGYIYYTNTPETRNNANEELIDSYDKGVTLAVMDESGQYTTIPPDSEGKVTGNYQLAPPNNSAGLSNSATYYIYDEEDLYTKVNQNPDEYPTPTEDIAELKIGVITVEASFVAPETPYT